MSVETIAIHTARARQAEAAAVSALKRVLDSQPKEVRLTGPARIALIVALSRAHVSDFTEYDWSGWCGAIGDAKVVTFHKHDLDYLMRALDIVWWGENVFVVLDETGLTFNGWEDARGYAYQVLVSFEVEMWDGERVEE